MESAPGTRCRFPFRSAIALTLCVGYAVRAVPERVPGVALRVVAMLAQQTRQTAGAWAESPATAMWEPHGPELSAVLAAESGIGSPRPDDRAPAR